MRSNVRTTETRPVFLRRKCVQLLGSLAREWKEHDLQDTTLHGLLYFPITESTLISLGRGRRKYRQFPDKKSALGRCLLYTSIGPVNAFRRINRYTFFSRFDPVRTLFQQDRRNVIFLRNVPFQFIKRDQFLLPIAWISTDWWPMLGNNGIKEKKKKKITSGK